MKSKFSEVLSELNAKDFHTDGPHGSIQWKGTSVCVDLYCKCGAHGHVDDEFFYYYRCLACGTRYSVGATIKLIELTGEQVTVLDCEDRFKDDPSVQIHALEMETLQPKLEN